MRQRYRRRHVFGRLVARIAEHHALIARAYVQHGAVARLQRAVHALRYVGRLPVQRRQHRARIGVKAVFGAVIAYAAQRIARYAVYVHVAAGGYLAHHHDQPGAAGTLARNARHRILSQYRIQHRVGYLVAYFVGMAFGHGFGCEQSLHTLPPINPPPESEA